jgi:hypothetical protein
MANVNAPFGMRFVGMLTGGAANASIRRYRIPASETNAIYLGDPVMRMTSSSRLSTGTTPSKNQLEGLEYVERATGTTGTVMLGVVVGFAFDPSDLTLNYCAGTLERDVLVCDDPNALFEIQSDSTGVAYTDLGMNACVTMTGGSSVTGISGAVLTTPAGTAAYPLLIMGWARDPKNDIATAAYVRVIVKINNHQLVIGANYAALGV